MEIPTLTVFEAIRKRPEMYIGNAWELIERLAKEAELQNEVRTTIIRFPGGFELQAENYKYEVVRPYNPGKGDCYLYADLTSAYAGGGILKNRCLMSYGAILRGGFTAEVSSTRPEQRPIA